MSNIFILCSILPLSIGIAASMIIGIVGLISTKYDPTSNYLESLKIKRGIQRDKFNFDMKQKLDDI